MSSDSGLTIDLSSAAGKAVYADALRIENEIRSHMKPRGELGLDPRLDDVRLKYGIPDGAFAQQPLYERVFVYQVDRVAGEKFENSLLFRPDVTKARDREEAPMGILIAAGLGALDVMASHGLELGDIVYFMKLAPLRIQCDTVGGHPRYILALKVGDLAAGVDLQQRLRSGELRIAPQTSSEDGSQVIRHTLVADGKSVKPVDPFQPSDY
jgi:hypothetical protein